MKKYSIETFLQCSTPESWLSVAVSNIPLLLIDHAHCEKKAAATALGMIYRYSDKVQLLQHMSKLAREELRHFEQVLAIIHARGETFYHLPPGDYATAMHRSLIAHEPKKLIDSLLLGAFIEARSCERFKCLMDRLPDPLATFYRKLYLAEARHFEIYLQLAEYYTDEPIDNRINAIGKLEAELITQEDNIFRFHSGQPTDVMNRSRDET